MLSYIRENRLLTSLYVFVCRFITVASIPRISVKSHSENLLGKPSLIKIGPKVLRI